MREIFRSYRKVYLNDLSKSLTPFALELKNLLKGVLSSVPSHGFSSNFAY